MVIISLFFVTYSCAICIAIVLILFKFINLLFICDLNHFLFIIHFHGLIHMFCSGDIHVSNWPFSPSMELSCIIWFYCYYLSSSSTVPHTLMIWKACLHCSSKFVVASFFWSLNWSRQNPSFENFVSNQEIAYLWETYLYSRTVQLYPWTICIADYELFVRNLVIRLSIVCDDHNWHELVQPIPARRLCTLLLSVVYDGLGSMDYRALPQLLVTQDLGSNDLEFCLTWALHWPQKEMLLFCCRRASTLLCLHMLYQPLASFNLDLHYEI
jgi:hypothetical protein